MFWTSSMLVLKCSKMIFRILDPRVKTLITLASMEKKAGFLIDLKKMYWLYRIQNILYVLCQFWAVEHMVTNLLFQKLSQQIMASVWWWMDGLQLYVYRWSAQIQMLRSLAPSVYSWWPFIVWLKTWRTSQPFWKLRLIKGNW